MRNQDTQFNVVSIFLSYLIDRHENLTFFPQEPLKSKIKSIFQTHKISKDGFIDFFFIDYFLPLSFISSLIH